MTAVAFKRREIHNPIDAAESAIMDRDWVFDRLDDGELIAEAAGQWGNYQVGFIWDEEHEGLTLSCALGAKCPKPLLARVQALLSLVNEKLWLGHFEIWSEEMTVAFRHSLLLPEGEEPSVEALSGLIDIAIEECDRFYPAFQSVIWGGKPPEEALALALFDTVAEA